MTSLSQAIDAWNVAHPLLYLDPQNKSQNQEVGLGSTIFASYSLHQGWEIIQLGCGNPLLACIARILRYLHLAYHDTRLNWSLRRRIDWINLPADTTSNPLAEFKDFFKNDVRIFPPLPLPPDPLIQEQCAFIKRFNEQRANGLTLEQRENLLIELNGIRQKIHNFSKDLCGTTTYSTAIKVLEVVASQLVLFGYETDSPYAIHCSMMQREDTDEERRAFFKWDNQFIDQNQEAIDSPPSFPIKVKEFLFEQRPALHQGSAQNYLCGYYALFNFLQEASNATLSDRTKFKDCFKEWKHRICVKRFLASLQNRKKEDPLEDIPFRCGAIPQGPIGLSLDEIKTLIMQSSSFEEIVRTQQWQLIELDNALLGEPVPIDPVFPSDNNIPSNLLPNTPIHLIVKYLDHYYYFKAIAEKREYCQVSQLIGAHSLGYSILQSFGIDNLSLLVKIVEQHYSRKDKS